MVSDEKLGLTTRLQKYLTDFTPMFKHLHFEHEATLSKRNGDDESHLLCRHLDDEENVKKRLKHWKMNIECNLLQCALIMAYSVLILN
ncbi:Uncharacterised protein [Actinobacillus equuli]|nr:Uncharacterised protein [Actinobacillus equuli]